MKKGGWIMYILIFVVVGMLFRGGCNQESAPPVAADDVVTVRAPVPDDNPALSEASMSVRVKKAETDKERGDGLGRFPRLPHSDTEQRAVHGVLYVYDEPGPHTYDESGTKFPLSTAALADDGTILAIKKTAPGPQGQKRISFEQPSRYVLQVRRDWFADRGLGAGDTLFLPPELLDVPPVPDQGVPTDTAIEADTEIKAEASP
jgi:hypothetical protein